MVSGLTPADLSGFDAQTLHEGARVNAKHFGEFEDVVQCEVYGSSLHLAEIRPMDVGTFGERFLAETQHGAALPDSASELPGRG